LDCDQHISDDRLIRCLQNIPSLITLELGGYRASSLGKQAMIQLAHRDSKSSCQDALLIVPNLQTIKLQYYSSSTFDDGAFVDMVASRWDFGGEVIFGRVARLKTVHVVLFHQSVGVNLESIKRLRAFRDGGLDICLRYESLSLSLLSNLEEAW